MKETSGQQTALKNLEHYISVIRNCLIQNKLKINDGNTEMSVFTIPGHNKRILHGNSQLKIGPGIKLSIFVRNLGAYLHSYVYGPKCKRRCKNMYYHLRCISGIRRHPDTVSRAKVIHSVVTSRERPHTTRFPSYDGSDRMRYVTTGRRRGSWQMTEIPSDY